MIAANLLHIFGTYFAILGVLMSITFIALIASMRKKK